MRLEPSKRRRRGRRLIDLPRMLVSDRRGTAGLIVALAVTLLIGFLGLAIDVAIWQTNQRNLQGTADQAAVAAYTAYGNNGAGGNFATSTAAINAATKTALAGGYPSTAITVAAYSTGSSCASNNCLSVTITQAQPRYFTGLFLSSNFTASASAVSTVATDPGACVMALDASGSGVITASGTPTLSLSNCNLYNNSPNTSATVLNGGATIDGCTTTNACGSQAFLAQPDTPSGNIDIPVNTNAVSAPDPFANVTPPTVGACVSSFPGNPVPSGTYCPGNINNQSVTFATGSVIVITGGLSTKGNSTLSCSGCTLYVTGGGSINANSNIEITAPSTGNYAGIAIWFAGSTAVTYDGNNSTGFSGAIYAPTTTVTFGGTNATSGNCARLIAGAIDLHGTPSGSFSNSGCPTNTTPGPVANLQGTLIH